jgi:hypothetical protein
VVEATPIKLSLFAQKAGYFGENIGKVKKVKRNKVIKHVNIFSEPSTVTLT